MELSEEPIIDKATKSGLSVPELSQGAFKAQEKAISDEQLLQNLILQVKV